MFSDPEVRRFVGHLPADLGFLPKFTLYENIKLFLKLLDFSKRYIKERMSSLDRLLRISDILDIRVANTSAGQKLEQLSRER